MEYIAYYRVSTPRQGHSGLGLDAQKAAAHAFARSNGGTILREYVEIETGRNSKRPVFLQAIDDARLAGATLLVAKLDRLARNLAFTATLMESGLEFVACDMPFANKLTIHIMAAMAEHESQLISERTKAALAQAKSAVCFWGPLDLGIGKKVKHHLNARSAARASAERRTLVAQQRYRFLMPAIAAMRAEGKSLREIAKALNESGHKTASGKMWLGSTVQRAILLAEEAA